jgi:phosphoribosylformimino-5-aminoimidazole carboxamide ribotide isomerase
MLIIPARDLQGGCVVRLLQGKTNKKIYSRQPLKVARNWARQGAKMLHVVDLDAAFGRKSRNLPTVKKIAAISGVPVEFGGGVRTLQDIEQLLAIGVKRVILGTKAACDEGFLKVALRKFKTRLIVSIDAKRDSVMVSGWKKPGQKKGVLNFALSLKKLSVKGIIYTDTLRDGTLSGPNIAAIKSLLKKSGLKIIASGGVSRLSDIAKLKKMEKKGLVGVIIGKALYEGKFTLGQALRYS